MTIETINPISAKPRMNPVAQYLLALATIIASYSAYIQFAVPFLEGPPHRPSAKPWAEIREPLSLREQKSGLEGLFPADAWELGACKTLLIDAGTILFKEIEQQPDGSLHITPFTLISGLEESDPSTIPPGTEKSTPNSPTVLRCLAGAKLKFNKPLSDLFSGNTKMESARLSGRVDIYRPPTQLDRDDAVHIITSNVQIEKHRIYTLERIQFAFGPNQGSGRNMRIDLAHDEESSVLADFSSIAGIRRLELAFLDELRIEPTSKPGIGNAVQDVKDPQPITSGNKLFASNKAPIEVTCSGPFVFDFQNKTASFQKQVVARQLDEFEDSLQCDELLLAFREKLQSPDDSELADIQPIASKDKPGEGLGASLELQRFIASGSPAVVVSRSQSAKISGDRLSYDILKGQIDGSCEPGTQKMVTIVSPEYQMVAKQLSYVLTEDGSLGEINVVGPGRILRAGGPDQEEFFSAWQNGLTSRNVPGQPGLQSVVIDGAAQVRVANETSVAAERLELLVWQIPKLETAPDQKSKRIWEYQPSKLITTGNVTIVSPQLDGQAGKLTATWPEPNNRVFDTALQRTVRAGYRGTIQIRSYNSNAPRQLASIPQRNSDIAPNSVRSNYQNRQRVPPPRSSGFVEQSNHQPDKPTRPTAIQDPNVRAAGFFREPNQQPDAAKPKLKFKGDAVEIRLTGTGDSTEILDLSIVGNVSIESLPKEPLNQQSQIDDHQPMTIEGHQLQLSPQSTERIYRVLITGKPGEMARVKAKGLILNGKNINLDQEANKVWIEGAGSMQLKLDPAAKRSADGLTGSVMSQQESQPIPENLDVKWLGGMIFDGSKIYFENGVEMSADRVSSEGNRSNTRSLSEGLSVELSKPVQFQRLQENKPFGEAKIRELVFVNQVPVAKQVFKMVNYPLLAEKNQKKSVVIENRNFDSAGEIMEQQRIAVPQAIVKLESGEFDCKGPGTVSTHRIRKPGNDDSKDPLARLASNNDDGQRQPGIMFIQINFDGTMSIDADRRAMSIDRNIRTVYAPVQNWSESFDPDRVRKRTPGTVLMTCDNLQLVQWTPRARQEATSELIASGNTHIHAEEFNATADRISYDKSTDQLVIVGTPRNAAHLRYKRLPNDTEPTALVADKFTYRLKDKATSVTGVKKLGARRN